MTHKKHMMLKRELNLFDATMMGLGSIIGTGIFVSIGVAAGATGSSVILAILFAAIVATCNAISSAELAAAYPVSGGTYAYGYRYLHPVFGFTAGWMFLCSKSASAATAALGFAGYLLHLFKVNTISITFLAITISIFLTIVVLSGLRKSTLTNIIIVSITLLSLILFVLLGLPDLFKKGTVNLKPFLPSISKENLEGFFYATALMFVAYTGYGRVATLGEEVKEPQKFIPRAIILTLIISTTLYIAVGLVAIGIVGADNLAEATHSSVTPLEFVAQKLKKPELEIILAIGACTAMLGVLLNLILGLSRIALAMGRKGDLPPIFSYVTKNHVPQASVIGVGIAITGLALTGNVETTWSFSAFTVLIYYSITNLAALHLPKKDRLYPKIYAIGGLISCLFLAFWVPTKIWVAGSILIIIGMIWHLIANKLWH